jgi:hypothetical protein
MATMNKMGLPQQNGTFEVRGIIFGMDKEDAFTQKMTKTQNPKPIRNVKFGVRTNKNSVIFMNLQAMEREAVYFSKRAAKKGEKPDVVKVDWKNRHNFKKEGYNLIGVNMGLKKVFDDKGNEVNDKVTLADYDAVKYIGDNLKDDQSVYIRGKIEYSTYEVNGETKHQTKLIPNAIYLESKPIDFDAEKFEEDALFTQDIVYMGLSRIEGTENGLVEANIVGYDRIENATFVLEDKNLIKNFKTLKPYTAISVHGRIASVSNAEEVEETDDDGWGTSNKMKRQNGSYVRQFIIDGADKESINKEVYSEKVLTKALEDMKKADQKEKGFDSQDDWGTVKKTEGDEGKEEESAW